MTGQKATLEEHLLTLHGLVREATRPAATGGTPLFQEEAWRIYTDSLRVLKEALPGCEVSE